MRSWTDAQLRTAVKSSHSVRSVIQALGLVPAGGNYRQVTKRISDLQLSTKHFTGRGWLRGKIRPFQVGKRLDDLLKRNSPYQSFKLKKRLFAAGYKKPLCELCGWAAKALDGRIPVELDHINGNPSDNRLQNLRILCPNCHSLQATHRGRNRKRPGGVIGRHARLKIS